MKNKVKTALIINITAIILSVSAVPLTEYMLSNGEPCFSLQKGIICPACGGTHAVNSFFKGNLAQSFNCNPAVFGMIIYLMLVILIINLDAVYDSKIFLKAKKTALHPIILLLLCIVYIALGFYRNL